MQDEAYKTWGKPVSHHILFTLITYSCTVTGGIHRNKPLADDSISSDQQALWFI